MEKQNHWNAPRLSTAQMAHTAMPARLESEVMRKCEHDKRFFGVFGTVNGCMACQAERLAEQRTRWRNISGRLFDLATRERPGTMAELDWAIVRDRDWKEVRAEISEANGADDDLSA